MAHATFEQLSAQHRLWMAHAKSVLSSHGELEQLAQVLSSLDRHGCWLRRVADGSSSLLAEGFVLIETRHTFVLVSEQQRVRALKRKAVFEMLVPSDGSEELYVKVRGDELVWRAN